MRRTVSSLGRFEGECGAPWGRSGANTRPNDESQNINFPGYARIQGNSRDWMSESGRICDYYGNKYTVGVGDPFHGLEELGILYECRRGLRAKKIC
jgi:hypothetical protein